MNAVRIHKFGSGPQDLVYEGDVMQPHPKEGEVLVKVYAAGRPRNFTGVWRPMKVNMQKDYLTKGVRAKNEDRIGHVMKET